MSRAETSALSDVTGPQTTQEADHPPAVCPLIAFRSDTLLVRAFLGRGSSVCVIVFDPRVDDLSLDREAFGQGFLASNAVDAVHILSARNDWYQAEDLPQALAVARGLTRRYSRVVTYGSSMGGYAALRFSAAVGAQGAIAVSPQYSAIAAVVPFDKRWPRLRSSVAWRHEQLGDRLPDVSEALIIYDDRNGDGSHAAAILNDLPHARTLRMPYAGHPAGVLLSEIGLLAPIVIGAAAGLLDTVAVQAAARANRHRSGNYHYALARRQPVRRLKLKARLARQANQVAPDQPLYLSYAGLVLECLGHHEEALAYHARATRRPGSIEAETRHARSLWRAGRHQESWEAAERARRLGRQSSPVGMVALLCALRGSPAEALKVLSGDATVMRWPGLARLIRALGRAPGLRSTLAGMAARRIAHLIVPLTALDRRHLLRELATADRD